ncbi:MAG TPA: AAA family ATPase [Actinomycetota bacterium]|nr:AAA family ATPase [Actinomycetota bacterium]
MTPAAKTAPVAKLKPLTSIGPGDEWPYIEKTLGKTHRVLLWGPPGTGKTTIANVFGRPEEVYNIYMTEETPAAELRGHFIPKGQEWIWNHGPAIKAWLNGQRLVINEINSASGDSLDFLLAVLDDLEIAGITLPNGDTVKPKPGFHCVATMNGTPEDLPEALRDRFSVRFNVRQAHPDAINALPQDLHTVARAKMKEVPSLRPWMEFAKLRETTGDENVAAYAVFENNAQAVLDAIKLARAPK